MLCVHRHVAPTELGLFIDPLTINIKLLRSLILIDTTVYKYLAPTELRTSNIECVTLHQVDRVDLDIDAAQISAARC
jgi:hypothetical protein